MSIRRFTVGIVSAAVLLAGAALVAQTTTKDHTVSSAAAPASPQRPAMDRQKMMADMQASQKKLDELVAAMNAAAGADKVDRIAAVVNEMVAMHKRMSAMMMQGGMMEMMHGAAQSPAPAAEDHAQHHTP